MKKLKIIMVLIMLINYNNTYSQEDINVDKVETIIILASTPQVLIIYPDNKIEKHKPRNYEAALLYAKEKMDLWLNEGYELSQLSDSSSIIIVLVKKTKQ